MSKYMKRWISFILAACLLAALAPCALTEELPAEAETPEAVEAAEVYSESAESEVEAAAEELTLEDTEEALILDEAAELPAAAEAEPEAPVLEDVAVKPYVYAWTVNPQTVIYRDEAMAEPVYTLSADEAVLVAARLNDIARVAFNSADGMVEGCVAASDIVEMRFDESEDLLDEMAAIGDVMLYDGDIDWPLPMAVKGQSLAASDFKRYSNDKEFVVQGKTITARMVGDHSDCWSWARALYKIIWGVKFDSTYVGDAKTGYNLIRNIRTDAERQLTGANLKKFLAQAPVGCTLRICSCPLSCSNIDKDGCPKHEKHSLMVIAKDEEGMILMDNMTGNGKDRYDTRYYTYDNFAKHWAKYKMIKYIKGPNAPEYDKSAEIAAANVQPESVTLSQTSVILTPSRPCRLTAAVLPANAADKSVTWSSSDPFICYADKDGNLVAAADGKVTITATTVNGKTASATVEAHMKDIAPTRVALDQTGTVYLNVGGTLQLNAVFQPAGATSKLTWKSSKKKVATVSADGKVTGVKAGTAVIAVKTANKKTAKVKVKVLKGNAVAKVKLDKSGTVKLNIGETLKLTPSVYPDTAKTSFKWKSSKKKVATVSADGTVTPVAAGTAVIKVITANRKTAKVKVKVLDPNAPDKVTLDKSGTVTLNVGETLKLTPSLSPDSAKTTFKWKSSKKKVATVSADGTVTAVKAGTAVIAVKTANRKTAKVKVKVVDAGKVSKVTLNPSGTVTLKVGETLQLTPAVTPETAKTTFKWKSSKKKVATVSADGLVTAVKAGTCVVAVATSNKKTAKVKVKVTK